VAGVRITQTYTHSGNAKHKVYVTARSTYIYH